MLLYPGMKKLLNLSELDVVMQNLKALKRVLTRDFDDPSLMPVVRDLSPQKVAVMVAWIEQQGG